MECKLMLMLIAFTCVNAMVSVDHGILTIEGYNKCLVDMNSFKTTVELNGDKYVHPGFVVGLLKWKCDDEYGSLVVDIECKDCGLYCSYNQQFEKCKNNWVLPAFAIVTSMFIMLVLAIVVMTCFKDKFNNIVLYLVWLGLTRNDRVRAKKVRMLNKITGASNPIFFRIIMTKSDRLNDMIMESRLNLRKELTGDEPIYSEICQKEYEANKFSKDLEMKVINSSHHRLGETAAKALVVGLAVQAAGTAYACDKTLFLSSSGKICDSAECTKVNMYSIPIQTGSTICFNTMEGERLEMRIKDSKTVTRYHSSYYACSFKVTTQTTAECKKVSGNCWNGGTCHEGYRHPSFTKEAVLPHGFGCKSDTIGCDTWCWHQTSCVWFKWVMTPIYDQCYKVYNKVSEIWQTSIFIKYKGITKHIKLNSNNPQYNLDGYDIQGLKNMPIVLTSFTHEQVHLRNAIVVAGKSAYEVDASMPNYPIKNSIGEFQMSLDKKTYVAYTSKLDCEMTSCKGNCTYDEPSVNRLTSNTYNKIQAGQVFKNGDTVLKRQIPVMASANLIIGSVELESLLIVPSHCKISVEHTMACVGCDQKPQAIFKAYDIRQEGLLEFETNCSWTQRALSCNPEPYIMTLEEDSDVCLINVKTTNQTLIIRFKFIFEGSLSLLKTYYAESAAEALESVVTDKAFWGTLVGSLNIMAFLSVGSVAILKVARLGIAYKTNKDLSSA